MDINSPVFKLQVITLIDSVCYGLVYNFLSSYIVNLGADQLIVGILSAGNLLCSLASSHIINHFAQIHGKRYTLYMVFNSAMVLHLMTISTNNYWFIIFTRYIFNLTNQSQNLCKTLLLQNVPEEKQQGYLKNFTILQDIGFIIGPFVAGYLFDLGFAYVCLLAAALTCLNIYLIMSMWMEMESSFQITSRSDIQKTQNKICEVIENVKTCDCGKNWDIIAIRYLYMMSIIVFSGKFTQILKHNFRASNFVIGYTTSYMHIVNFAGMHFIDNINKYVPNFSVLVTVEYGLLTTGISVLLACYLPIYSLYVIMCLPIFFCYNFMISNWNSFSLIRGNDSLSKVNDGIDVMTGVTTPLIFGLTHKFIGHHAVVFCSAIPVFGSLTILKMYTNSFVDDTLNKED